jgi:hypothetical protein
MNFRKYLSNVRDYDLDDALGLVGLQKRSAGDWVFPMLAGLGAGMAIGAGLAFFLTPYRGDEAREKVRKGASDAQRMLSEKVSMLSDKVSTIINKEEGGIGTTGARPVVTTSTQNIGGGNAPRGY